jgi:hypothetical protein
MEDFLREHGWKPARTRENHDIWTKAGMLRSAVVDTKFQDVPDDHITSILRAMHITRRDLRKFLA